MITESSSPLRRRGLTRLGALAWTAGVIAFAAANVAAQAAWNAPGAPYSLRDNNISDLGHVHCAYTGADNPPVRYVCSPWHTLIDASMVVHGVLLIVGILLTWRLWGRGHGPMAARVLLIIGGLGYVLAGRSPADVDLDTHVLGAFCVIGGANLGLLVAAVTFRHGHFAALFRPTLLLATVACVAATFHFSRTYLGLGMGGTERLAVFALDVWLLIMAVHILRRRAESSGAGGRPGPGRASPAEA